MVNGPIVRRALAGARTQLTLGDTMSRIAIGFALLCFGICGCSSNTTVVPPAMDGGAIPALDGGATPSEDGGATPAEDGGATPAVDGGMLGADGGTEEVGDLCNGVTTQGRCASAMVLEDCVVTTENADPRLVTTNCVAGETCQVQNGKAACVLTAACRNDDTECVNANELRTCTSNNWVTTACANGCVTTPAGGSCATTATTTPTAARVVYERRTINGARNALGDPFDAPARGFAVTLERGGQVLSSTVTSTTDGTFSLRLPAALEANDKVKVTLLASEGNTIAVALLNPNLPAGKRREAEVSTNPPSAWSFEFPAANLQAASPVLRITEAGHSGGVATVFDETAAIYRDMKARYGRAGAPLIVWMGPGVQWDCGACQGDQSATYFGTRFEHMIWYPADTDRSYYSSPVIGHEAGHYVMAAFGRSPGEGGGHSVTCKSFPGLAWSDGFATWIGQVYAASPIYFDIQEGGLFWYDVAARSYDGDAQRWPARPTPSGSDVVTSSAPGLLQKISEGEVCAILWQLSNGAADPNPILNALASPRMTRTIDMGGVQRFERGYFRHDWTFVQATCTDNRVTRLSEPAPMMADLLDAMMCAGFPRDRMDAATVPATYYPYPSGAPACR